MKITSQQNIKREFQPCSIEIVFETQQELDAFGSLFNLIPITDAVERFGIDDDEIRREIENLNGHCSLLHDALGRDIKDGFKTWRSEP